MLTLSVPAMPKKAGAQHQASNAAESLGKGARVLVVGRPKERTWTDQDGIEHHVTEVDAEELGPSLRWATAKVMRANGTGRKASGHTEEPPS
jgi:single-strand DNA-binding protein